MRALTRRPTVAEAMALGLSLRASFQRVSSWFCSSHHATAMRPSMSFTWRCMWLYVNCSRANSIEEVVLMRSTDALALGASRSGAGVAFRGLRSCSRMYSRTYSSASVLLRRGWYAMRKPPVAR
nr:hypothetical protein [Human alphaherpesvirus 2]